MRKKSKAERSKSAQKAAKTRKQNKKNKKQVNAAKKASRKNIRSEDQFVERLRKKGYFAFKTGKAEGPPDIIAYKNKNLKFFEIKPAFGNSRRSTLLKQTQHDWIKKYCLKKKIEANLSFYIGTRHFKYAVVRITKKNISSFVDNQKNRDSIIERTKSFSYK